jgi:coenzyme F420 hydrogenase subunit beta
VCPGIAISHEPFKGQTISELRLSWGPILEIWEGYAAEPEIRFKASSGGIATALSLFCLLEMRMSGVLHTGVDAGNPLVNTPVFSRNREQLVSQAGSRYSPAAPCSEFDVIKEADSPCVFVGKPCDVAALRKSQSANIALASKVGLAISIFCAGTPSSQATKVLLDTLGIEPDDVAGLRYRGYGWPGITTVKLKGANGEQREMSYEESWGGILSRHVALRCRLCPDSTGEFADISCGDPWYRPVVPANPGCSLVLVRTERGQEVLKRAMCTGYVRLQRADAGILPQSQKTLLNRRRHLFGRLLAMQMMFVPTPHFEGFSLFANWCCLSVFDKIRSVFGTLRRIYLRKWTKPLNLRGNVISRSKLQIYMDKLSNTARGDA